MSVRTPATDKFLKVRAALILDHPFFGSLALRLKPVEVRDMVVHGYMHMTTLAVDGQHIYYHPDFVSSLSVDHLKFIVAHEVMHCVWNHVGGRARRGDRDPVKWNIAGDFVINDLLKNLKDDKGRNAFDMPPMGLWDEKYSHKEWTADRVYLDLPDPPPRPQMSVKIGLKAPNPKGDEDGQPQHGKGHPQPGEKGGGFDFVLDGPPEKQNDESERNQQQREWKVATIQAANSARMQGKLFADLERFLEQLFKPQVDWVERLRQFVSAATRDDYDWRRPNKRFPDVYLPSLYNEQLGEIVVVIDDSGSIDDVTLAKFAAEIKAIVEDCRPETTHLIYCDSSVKAHYKLKVGEDIPLKVHGGGGTDFNPPFDLVREKGIVPKCLIYLTDLYGPWPKLPPPYPVTWVCITDRVCDWGETIHLDRQLEEEDK